jgi:DNA-directed RNA polymerase specialized sigma24 family protein
MNLSAILDEIKGNDKRATADNIRGAFGDYHNLLRWLAAFLVGEQEINEECIVDACTIAEAQGPEFHEWLVHWAARATVNCLFEKQQDQLADLARQHANGPLRHSGHPPLSPDDLSSLIKHSEEMYTRLDLLSRFVLILHGLGNLSCDDVASKLRISVSAVERAYCAAYDTLRLISGGKMDSATRSTLQLNRSAMLTRGR